MTGGAHHRGRMLAEVRRAPSISLPGGGASGKNDCDGRTFRPRSRDACVAFLAKRAFQDEATQASRLQEAISPSATHVRRRRRRRGHGARRQSRKTALVAEEPSLSPTPGIFLVVARAFRAALTALRPCP